MICLCVRYFTDGEEQSRQRIRLKRVACPESAERLCCMVRSTRQTCAVRRILRSRVRLRPRQPAERARCEIFALRATIRSMSSRREPDGGNTSANSSTHEWTGAERTCERDFTIHNRPRASDQKESRFRHSSRKLNTRGFDSESIVPESLRMTTRSLLPARANLVSIQFSA